MKRETRQTVYGIRNGMWCTVEFSGTPRECARYIERHQGEDATLDFIRLDD